MLQPQAVLETSRSAAAKPPLPAQQQCLRLTQHSPAQQRQQHPSLQVQRCCRPKQPWQALCWSGDRTPPPRTWHSLR
jgi:hypothetical protein